MDIQKAKALGAELSAKLPWQEIADSPTVRYYTDWSKFEGFRPITPRPTTAQAGPCEVVVRNGVLAGVGKCNGVEVSTAREVFTALDINNRILALHAAALQEAVFIKAREVFLLVRLEAREKGGHVATHVLLDIGPGASVLVHASSGEGVMHTAVIEGVSNGPVEYILLSDASGPHYVHSAIRVASGLSARPLAVGGVMNAVREEYIIGEEATAEVVGLELGFGNSRIDHVVSVVNDAPRGRGYAKLLAIAADRSFVTQRAVGRITKRGVWSDNAVEGVVYIAGDEAAANTQPIILVETGEVSGARHSAADASLDEEKEFFLRARGVRKQDLPKLLVWSLVDQYLSSISERARPVVEEAVRPFLQA